MRSIVLILFVLSYFVAISGWAQERSIDWGRVQVKVQKMSASLYVLQEIGGKVGAFVSDDALVH